MGKTLSDTMNRVAVLEQSHECMAKEHKKMQEKRPETLIKDLLLELFGADDLRDFSMTADCVHRTLAPKSKS